MVSRRFVPALALALLIALPGCHREVDETGSYPASDTADCLPDLQMVDQEGVAVSPASLKGGYVLVDFIYTGCTGTCPMLTEKMLRVSHELGAELGRKVRIVSVSLDPEHDTPAVLKKYAAAHGASGSGWIFLTAAPERVDQYLALYKIRRVREPDGTIDHVTAAYLLGPDGHQIRQYNGLSVSSDTIVADLHQAETRG